MDTGIQRNFLGGQEALSGYHGSHESDGRFRKKLLTAYRGQAEVQRTCRPSPLNQGDRAENAVIGAQFVFLAAVVVLFVVGLGTRFPMPGLRISDTSTSIFRGVVIAFFPCQGSNLGYSTSIAFRLVIPRVFNHLAIRRFLPSVDRCW